MTASWSRADGCWLHHACGFTGIEILPTVMVKLDGASTRGPACGVEVLYCIARATFRPIRMASDKLGSRIALLCDAVFSAAMHKCINLCALSQFHFTYDSSSRLHHHRFLHHSLHPSILPILCIIDCRNTTNQNNNSNNNK